MVRRCSGIESQEEGEQSLGIGIALKTMDEHFLSLKFSIATDHWHTLFLYKALRNLNEQCQGRRMAIYEKPKKAKKITKQTLKARRFAGQNLL